ncbi:hypothetical protein chiPu_0007269 [Chiloscyllium punctatum]|uniref:Uncharacterized protein n=1 Tax=Chiloscyllium punctatum TaxID=137246 RepID=A0A401SEK2_CHIPU|nr:hypothetical protein [Chiloscyllium punctatum]
MTRAEPVGVGFAGNSIGKLRGQARTSPISHIEMFLLSLGWLVLDYTAEWAVLGFFWLHRSLGSSQKGLKSYFTTE